MHQPDPIDGIDAARDDDLLAPDHRHKTPRQLDRVGPGGAVRNQIDAVHAAIQQTGRVSFDVLDRSAQADRRAAGRAAEREVLHTGFPYPVTDRLGELAAGDELDAAIRSERHRLQHFGLAEVDGLEHCGLAGLAKVCDQPLGLRRRETDVLEPPERHR